MKITAAQRHALQKTFKKEDVRVAYLFGSQAQGHATAQSDVDVAVVLDSHLSLTRRFEARLSLMTELSRLFKNNTEVVIINDTSSIFFKYVILKEGTLLFTESEAERADVECRILTEYLDFQPFLEEYSQNYVQHHLS